MKFTPTQQLWIHAAISMVAGACMSGLTALYQYYAMYGTISVPVVINVGLIAFLAFFSKALYEHVPGHVGEMIQFLSEAITELQAARHDTIHPPTNNQTVPLPAPGTEEQPPTQG